MDRENNDNDDGDDDEDDDVSMVETIGLGRTTGFLMAIVSWTFLGSRTSPTLIKSQLPCRYHCNNCDTWEECDPTKYALVKRI
jgi:hypothetical protein